VRYKARTCAVQINAGCVDEFFAKKGECNESILFVTSRRVIFNNLNSWL